MLLTVPSDSDYTAALVLLGGIVFIIGVASAGVDLTTKNVVLDLAPVLVIVGILTRLGALLAARLPTLPLASTM